MKAVLLVALEAGSSARPPSRGKATAHVTRERRARSCWSLIIEGIVVRGSGVVYGPGTY